MAYGYINAAILDAVDQIDYAGDNKEEVDPTGEDMEEEEMEFDQEAIEL